MDLAPGKIICVHISHASQGGVEEVENVFSQMAKRQGRRIALCRRAAPGFHQELAGQEETVEWLSRVGGISATEAKRSIVDLGIRVADRVLWNAGTSRAMLAVAASLIGKPDVIIYASEGLDPEGCQTLHRFVMGSCVGVCIVHLSGPSVFGNGSAAPRNCPAGAQCLSLGIETQI